MRFTQIITFLLLASAPSSLFAEDDCKASLTTQSRMNEILNCFTSEFVRIQTEVEALKAENAELLETIDSYSNSSIERIVHMQRDTTSSDVDRRPIISNGEVLKVADAFCVLSGVRGRFDGSPENFSVYTIDGVWHFTHKGGAAAIGGSIDCYSFNTTLVQN